MNTTSPKSFPSTKILEIPVLIIGGGPVGLSMALALARQNIRSIVIERHSGKNEHPRARGVNIRTMELFRQWGNITELSQYQQPNEARRFIWARSLQGEEITRVNVEDAAIRSYSPVQSSLVTQDCVEDSLFHTLKNYNESKIEFLKEFISFEQDDQGVTVRILNRQNTKEEFVRTKYLIACDGARSSVRQQCGIAMDGPDDLGRFCSVYCEFDIENLTKYRPCIGFFFTDPNLSGRSLFYAHGENRWIVGMRFNSGMDKNTFTNEYCIKEIRRVTAIPDLQIKIINKSFWTMAAQVANQFRKGQIFLAGDAAHRLPPTGGFGMNTGIQDAHNLAWKLAFVLQHKASENLLNSYYTERAPVVKENIRWSTENAKRYSEINTAIQSGDFATLKIKLQDQQKSLNNAGLDLGFIYHSEAIISENDQTISISPEKYMPTTLPGSRAPHVNLIQAKKEISTLDLFEKEYVLLIGKDSEAWGAYAKEMAKSIPLKIYQIGQDLIEIKNDFYDKYEIPNGGAVLVRPDGHVAWRSQQSTNTKELLADLECALTRFSLKLK